MVWLARGEVTLEVAVRQFGAPLAPLAPRVLRERNGSRHQRTAASVPPPPPPPPSPLLAAAQTSGARAS